MSKKIDTKLGIWLLFVLMLVFCFVACDHDVSNEVDSSGETPNESVDKESVGNAGHDAESTLNSGTGIVSSSEKTADIELLSCDNVQKGGVVLIHFTMDNKEYSGVVNSKGELFYYAENLESLESIGKDYGYISEYDRSGLLNYKTGETKWFSPDDFDKVIGYGDGFLLTYKNNSTIATAEYIYSVVDASTGKVIQRNTSSKQLEHPDQRGSFERHEYVHVGDGWFLSMSEEYGVSSDSWLYDSNANVSYILEKVGIVSKSFVNGKLYMKTSSYTVGIFRRNSDGQGQYIDFPSSITWYFSFDQKGSVEAVSSFTAGATGLNVVYQDVEYLQLLDTKTQTVYKYKDFPANMIKSVTVYDNYCIVYIRGADGYDYFTLIDKKGEQLFDPIRYRDTIFNYSYVKLFEDRLVYYDESQESNMFDRCRIFDLKGKELFSIEYIDSDEIIEFYNGITVNENKIIDKLGNEIEIVMK